jgi:calcium-translocating P-type ATPase
MTSDALGLSYEQAALLLSREGPNTLPRVQAVSAVRQLLAQFLHFFALLLWAASALAVVAGLPQLGIAIALVVIVNGVFAFVQEHRAERAARKLGELLPRRVVVRRSGEVCEVDAAEVVVGDVLLLAAGDRVAADVEVLQACGLSIDESPLTGESATRAIGAGDRAFAGTFVVEGEACCRVSATGAGTRLAAITELSLAQRRPVTPLARELSRLVRTVALIALGLGVSFFAIGALVGLPLRDGFLFAIGVAVALVPEGLLPTVTLSLAVGASRMAKRGALVRRLDAVETLGATTFICSDKTGTLTRNQMSVVELWTPLGTGSVRGVGYEPHAELELSTEVANAARRMALVAARCSSGRAVERGGEWVALGDPMEAALHALASRLGVDLTSDEQRRPERARFPFDPRRRRMSVVVSDEVLVKGAAEAVLAVSDAPAGAREAAEEMAGRGLRVMAVARGRAPVTPASNAQQVERELELLGLLGLFDPPRAEVREAIARCRQAGIRIAMVTGDQAGTARAVAERVGMQTQLVVTGDQLPDDEALLGALMDRDGVVACRVSPEQKQRIARALQARGHVVAMTGDGVNDAPALRQADVGVAMGRSGTDVARESADLVLLDDRFETIVLAVEQGRAAFANVRRFLTYHLTDNVPELAPFVVWALSGGRLPLALGVLQILCLDLLTDQSPALALGAQPPGRHALERSPRQTRLIDRALLLRAGAVLGMIEALVALLAFGAVLWSSGFRPESPETASRSALAAASGAAFLAVAAGQTATALCCRSSTRPAWQVPLGDNRLLLGALLVSWLLVALLLGVPWLARLLGQGVPTPLGAGIALSAFPLVLLFDAVHKALSHRGTTA